MWYKFLYLYLLFGGAQAFLATPLNYSDPDVINIFCPDQAVGETRDHEWITREGIRRSIRTFFMDNPPLGSGSDFFVDEDATLTELYHAYYGPASSPTRFIKAVNSVAAANVKTDSSAQSRYDPAIQGDGEHLDGLQATLVARYPQILTSIIRDEAYSAARSLLGTSLHSIQKFYSHSTWIEQGNSGILESLGIPGSDIGTVAGPSEDVCTPCVDAQGRCEDNVLTGAALSSGYYNYEDSIGSGFLIPKPTTGGKCSHGGKLDESSTVQAIGGINKDTASPCFSPHHYLHEQAAELAVQATQYYLDNLLQAVGNEKFRRLFDLYLGSALSICIDTTGSMGDDIDAVKDQVAEIVNSTRVELYLLVPFSDPDYGPLLMTDNAVEFLNAVNALVAFGGGDGPELFWKGLQLALSRTPDYGNIFCFTDAEAKNGELMEGLIAQAQQQYSKVTVILSDLILSSRNDHDDDDDDNDKDVDHETREFITGVAEYQRLADSTGGLLISTDKFDVADIANIIGGGVESSTVTVVNLIEIIGPIVSEVLIDNSIMDFEVRISGSVTEALLTDEEGTEYDLTDRASLEALPNVEVISHTSSFKAIKWTAPKYGEWRLRTSSFSLYSLIVMATSTFDFLAEFAVLDPSPPHPHYRQTEGNPLMNTVYYLQLTLIGHLESKVVKIKSVEFLDKAGALLRQINYVGEVTDQIYIRTEPLPETPFYINLSGHVSSGNRYSRLMSVLIQPVETTVDVWATSQDLSARPGESASAQFLVTNFGLESNFTITGTDDMGFLISVEPSSLYLNTNGSLPVIASFTVPEGTPHGTVSTVIITAQSQKQTQSVNSAIAHFVVLPEEQDLVKPMCVITNPPNCTGYNYNGICETHSWIAEASLQDELSGLYSVYARPEGSAMNINGLTPGTNGVVLVDYEASCCTLKADIIGVDGQGNVGKCSIDMGVLGGMIYDFQVDSIGDSWAILHWNITPSAYDIKYYILTINDDGLRQIPCKDPYCVDYANYLEPCAVQHFNLTPVFNYEGSTVEGYAAFTEATTMENEPSAPYNGTEIDATETTITVTWEASICSSLFEVCYFEVGEDPSTATCDTTTEKSYVMTGLSKCKAYFADVVAVSPSGLESTTLEFYGVTICPGS